MRQRIVPRPSPIDINKEWPERGVDDALEVRK
jgi:hypothetical protein